MTCFLGQREYLFKIITVAVQILLHACRLRSACTRRNTDPDDEIELNESEHARTFAAAELGALERRPRPDELHQPRRRVHVGARPPRTAARSTRTPASQPPPPSPPPPWDGWIDRDHHTLPAPPPHAPCAADHLMITFNFTPRSASWSSRKAS